jgi:dCMP deaminase
MGIMRPTLDEWSLGIAKANSVRADCVRRQVGAIIYNTNGHIIAMGYNGTRAGVPGCLAGACPRGRLSYDEVKEFSDYNAVGTPGYCISTHAEVNCLIHAYAPVQGCTMAITDQPCEGCRKAIYNAGLIRVIWPTGSYNFS